MDENITMKYFLKFSGNYDTCSPGKLAEAICALLLSFIVVLEYTKE